MYNLVGNIEFQHCKNKFQEKLANDIKNLKSSEKFVIPADKTSNFYKVDEPTISCLLITSQRSTRSPNTKLLIDKETRRLSKSINLDDRMQVHTTTDCFLTLKDQKPDFRTNPKCRLINPAKTDLGKVTNWPGIKSEFVKCS